MALGKIVVISKDSQIQQLGYHVSREVLFADDLREGLDISWSVNPELVLLDSNIQPENIPSFLETADNNLHAHIVIIGTACPNPPVQSDSIHYVSDISDFDKLIANLFSPSKELRLVESKVNAAEFFCDELSAAVSMAGKSRAVQNTIKMINLVAESNCNPVLIIGETGTGKELAAKAVHLKRHPDEKFVAVNCAALTATLLESELFGHVKGSFTGADKDKTGLLELAGCGTIFLDEISEMPLELQAKLLRVLQEKTFRKVGGTNDLVCKATIIASSNRDLRQEVKAKRFRQDLYYRLNICPIVLAALRDPQRKSDIRLLAHHFLNTSTICQAKKDKITSFTQIALEALERHDWPGNVRELRNVIERAIILETTDKIGLSSIIIDSDDTNISNDGKIETDEDNLIKNISAFSADSMANSVNDFSLEKAERELIARALQESGWQKTKAAALLGITRATLYAKVKQHNIQKGTYLPKIDSDDASFEAETVSLAS